MDSVKTDCYRAILTSRRSRSLRRWSYGRVEVRDTGGGAPFTEAPPGEVEMELRKELALALYRRGVLSSGKARQLVGMTRWQFEELLGERRVVRHYTEKDLAEDQAYARSDH